MRNLRILIVSQYFWPEGFRVNDLAVGLRDRGHSVTVLTGMPNYPGGSLFPGYSLLGPRRELYQGMDVIRVPLLPRRKGKAVDLALNYLSFAGSASLLGPLRCRGEFDLIFVFEPSPVTVGIPALVMKRAKRAPIVFWVQDLWPESLVATGAVRSPTMLRMVSKMASLIYRGCDRVLVTSRGFVPRVQALGVRPEQVRYFPQWAERTYQPMDLEKDAPERAAMPDGFRIVFAGNIGAAQGFPTILDAAEELRAHPDIQWVILGDGRMRPWVEEQVRERKLRATVHLLGRYPMETMPRFFSLADAMLVTLKGDPILALTIPGKVQSYLACARPIIASVDGEGARVIEEAGAGVTCPPEDPKGLAQAVLELYHTPSSQRKRMGLSGRAYYEANFKREMLLDRLNIWLEELAQL